MRAIWGFLQVRRGNYDAKRRTRRSATRSVGTRMCTAHGVCLLLCAGILGGGDDGLVGVEGGGRGFVDDLAFVFAVAPVLDGGFHLSGRALGEVEAPDAGDGDEIVVGEDANVELVVIEVFDE